MFSRFFRQVHDFLHQPLQVFALAGLLTMLILIVDGGLWKYWSLKRSQEQVTSRMEDLIAKSEKLEFQIHEAKKLTYIERQATDQFDYVREGDLIFVFSE